MMGNKENEIIEEIILKNKNEIIKIFFQELSNRLPYAEDTYFYQHSDSATEVMINRMTSIMDKLINENKYPNINIRYER